MGRRGRLGKEEIEAPKEEVLEAKEKEVEKEREETPEMDGEKEKEIATAPIKRKRGGRKKKEVPVEVAEGKVEEPESVIEQAVAESVAAMSLLNGDMTDRPSEEGADPKLAAADDEDMKEENSNSSAPAEEGEEHEKVEPESEEELEEDFANIKKSFAHIKDEFFKNQIEALEKEIESIKAETHETYLERVSELQKREQERIWAAIQWRELQKQSLEIIIDQEAKQAEEAFEEAKRQLKISMARALARRKKETEDAARHLILAGKILRSRKIRRLERYYRPDRCKLRPAHINCSLSPSEIYEDLNILARNNYLAALPSFPNTTAVPAN